MAGLADSFVCAQAQKEHAAIVEKISNVTAEVADKAKALFLLRKVIISGPLYIVVYSLLYSI